MENTIFQQMGEHGPRACRFLNVEHHFHSSYQKSIIERTIQYVKDRTESFDDYFPCRSERRRRCKVEHILNWFKMFDFIPWKKV